MKEQESSRLNLFLIIFAASGFSGLIYESIWTHYLKLFLGHAAYAQTLVLAIFMGGMALGSWLSSRYAISRRDLLIRYAAVEGIVGLFALVFHDAFDQTVRFSYATVIPVLSSSLSITVYKWTLSTLMILPQSILLGMTFPLMSAGIIRRLPHDPGKTLSLLYFTNSIGAAIGVLASGFLLIRLVGLPWTIRAAGFINIALAVSVYLLVKQRGAAISAGAADSERDRQELPRRWYWYFLIVSLATGLASFIYEIGWIRMLSLVLGSSTHAFELMLSSFIAGLALGSLWIHRRIDRMVLPERALSLVQITMGLLALSTLPVYGYSFHTMQWLVNTLSKTETGYVLFNLSSNIIALSVMLPTTFCAGMTLPLITFILLKRGYGERSIGTVYAANTVGAIVGVFFAVHVGMPELGLKGLMIFGGSIDIVIGVVILWGVVKHSKAAMPVVVSIAAILAIAGTALFVALDPYEMASGVYRFGILLTKQDGQVLYHKDGKTATISIALTNDGVMSLRTNGKVDAGLIMRSDLRDHTFPDESTTVLLGLLPIAMNPQASEAAVIGFGSGLTTHTVLASPNIREVDTVEIERCVLDASKHFLPRVERAYFDRRSKVYIDDAKTFFVQHKKKYDVIVSEPSNPWVSGVAGLFSTEFYRQMKEHLTDAGLLVQWIHLYEIDTSLVVSVLKALSANFHDFSVYATNDGDIVVIAKKAGSVPNLDPSIFKIPWIADVLKGIRIESIQDFRIRHIGNKAIFGPMLESFPVRTNSDYFPVLDQNAARARYLRASAQDLLDYAFTPLPAMEMLTHDELSWTTTDIRPITNYYPSNFAYAAMALRDYSSKGIFDDRYASVPANLKDSIVRLRRLYYDCRSEPEDPVARFFILFYPSGTMLPYLTPHESEIVWKNLESGRCASTISASEKKWVRLFKAVGQRDANTMASQARSLLESELHMPPVAEKYLVAAGMLGSLAQGDSGQARDLWSLYQPELVENKDSDLLFRVLAGQSAKRP